MCAAILTTVIFLLTLLLVGLMGHIVLAVALLVVLLPLGWFGWKSLHFLAAQWAAVLEERRRQHAVQCLMLWIEILAEYLRKRALHCAVLGVDVDATKGAIKRAYRKLALKWHTDRNKEDGAQEMMQKINAAKAFLLP